MDKLDIEFIRLLRQSQVTSIPVYLGAVACIGCESGHTFVGKMPNYSRGDYKRAIKHLRIVQKQHPEYSETYDNVISYIRKYWLKRDGITPPPSFSVYVHFAGDMASPVPGSN